MRLYLIRHGETDWNKERLLQGQSDIPLNEFGRKLAHKTATGLKDVNFDGVFTSPLSRAKETATIVIDDAAVPVIEDARIQEMGFGEFEGLCCSKEGWNIPDPDFQRFFTAPHQYKVPKGGESFGEVIDRVKGFCLELFHNSGYQDSTLLVATHGATLRAMLGYFKKVPLDEFWNGGVHSNCAVSIVDVVDGEVKIVAENVVYYDDKVNAW